MVLAGQKPPYFVTCMAVPDTAGLAPIEANVECLPGIPMRLKLIDKETGKPVRNADVYYQPIYPNPTLAKSPATPRSAEAALTTRELFRKTDLICSASCRARGLSLCGRHQDCIGRHASIPKKFFKVKDSPDPKHEGLPLYGDTDMINTAVGEGWAGTPQSQFSAHRARRPGRGFGSDHRPELVLERDPKREVRAGRSGWGRAPGRDG